MSLSREETVVCPGCGTPGPVILQSSLDVARDPEAKERLLRGRLSVFTCAKCGREARIVHALLYVDAARGLVVQLDPEGMVEATPALGDAVPRVSRRVREGNTLLEKVRLDDAGLDDRVVEVMKLLLAVVHAQYMDLPWYFERLEADGSLLFTIVTPGGPHATRRPRAEYDRLAADLLRRGALADPGPFAKIDREYAREWLSRPEPA